MKTVAGQISRQTVFDFIYRPNILLRLLAEQRSDLDCKYVRNYGIMDKVQ